MQERPRYLEEQVQRDLRAKMVFVGGPRQVGKTTMARRLLGDDQSGYLNWDVAEHRERILMGELPPAPRWAFDELHKYRPWRNFLKGPHSIPGNTGFLQGLPGESPRIIVAIGGALALGERGAPQPAPSRTRAITDCLSGSSEGDADGLDRGLPRPPPSPLPARRGDLLALGPEYSGIVKRLRRLNVPTCLRLQASAGGVASLQGREFLVRSSLSPSSQ